MKNIYDSAAQPVSYTHLDVYKRQVQTLPIAIYSMTKKRVSPEINALSTIMFVVILTIILAVNGVEAARDKRTARAARREARV